MRIPQIPKPWNPAYRETWEAMTPRERRISFLIDVGIVLGAISFIGWIA